MSSFYFIIGALATYRLTVLIARDAGPLSVFKKLRSLDKGTKVLKCPFCVSIWAATIICVGFYLLGSITETPMAWFCILLSFSAIAIMLDRAFTADYQA